MGRIENPEINPQHWTRDSRIFSELKNKKRPHIHHTYKLTCKGLKV